VAEYTLKLDLAAELDDPVYRHSKKLRRVERHIRQMPDRRLATIFSRRDG
jgi:hypothetical protein